MAGGVDKAVATFERNIEAQTGKSIATWVALVRKQKFARHGEMMAWLKSTHALTHAHANHVAKRTLEAEAPRVSDDPVGHMFEGKEDLRPIYKALLDTIKALGSDVEIAPKKANVSIRRRKQFALIQPSTRTRMDLGLIIRERAALGRLEASGSFNAMFTHRVKLTSTGDVDASVRRWLKEAYNQAL